jgi:hypothetical protein
MFDLLDRLEQVILEDTYGKHNNNAIILDDIKSGLDKPIAKAVGFIEEYFSGEYWPSKNDRIDKIKNIDPIEIINCILVSVMSYDHDISYQQVVAPLAKLLACKELLDSIQTAAELIAVVCFSNLYEVIAASDSESGSLMIRNNYSLDKATQIKLEKTKYLPPLVVLPNVITSNHSSGYLTKKDSVILGKGNHHEKPLALDVLNILNSIKLTLDVRALEYEEAYKELSEAKKRGLTKVSLTQRKANHTLMAETSVEIYNMMLDKGNEFYITWKYDKRGRVYSAGYHINIQSTDYKKSLINLAKKEVILCNN